MDVVYPECEIEFGRLVRGVKDHGLQPYARLPEVPQGGRVTELELAARMSAKASKRCRAEVLAIEDGLSPCFKMNPGRKLDKKRCGELRRVLDRLEAEEKKAFQRVPAR